MTASPHGACFVVSGLVRTHRPDRSTVIRAVDGVDLDIGAGELFGILGPNGAGKTTLVRLLVGLLRPDAGSVRLLGHDVVSSPGVAARAVAYLAQVEPALDDMPVGVAVETTARLRGLPVAAARDASSTVMTELGIGGLVARPVGRLSGGQRRIVAVAAALVGDRPVLVLDEPTTGLDLESRRAVWAALDRRRREHGATVVLVTHNVLEAETVLDRVAVLDAGRVIACDTPGRLKAAVSDDVRLELVWRSDPPIDDPAVAALAGRARASGRRWSARLPAAEARAALDAIAGGPAFAALDDFTLATPTLEDVYLALGGRSDDLERV